MEKNGQPKDEKQVPQTANQTVPHVGHALDGSQFQDVIEEQEWAEKRPRPEEEKRRDVKP